MTIRKQADALWDALKKELPDKLVEDLDAGRDEIMAAGAEQRCLSVGDQAPDFRLPSATGASVSLGQALSQGPVVLVFYRGDWCPYCNLALRAYQNSLAEFQAAGASLIAISPQTPDYASAISHKNALAFEVLSDEGCQVASRYGLAFDMPAKHVEVLASVGLAQGNREGDTVNRIPLPATYVIDSHAEITWAHIDPDYRARAETEDIVMALRALQYFPSSHT